MSTTSRLFVVLCEVAAILPSIVVTADDQALLSQTCRADEIARGLQKAGVNVFSVRRGPAEREVTTVWKIDERPQLFEGTTDRDLPMIDDALMERLPELPGLTEVALDSTQVTDEGLQQLPRIRSLHFLELSDTLSHHKAGAITDRGIHAIARCRDLRKLRIWGIPVSAEGWQLLGGLKCVEEMTIGYCVLSPKDLAAIATLPNLRVFKLYASECEESGLRALWRSHTVEKISLQRSSFDLRDLDGIEQCQQLTHIDGSFTSIDDGAVRAMCVLRNLQELNIGHTMVTDESAILLAKCTNLKVLLVGDCLSEATRDELRRKLPQTTVP